MVNRPNLSDNVTKNNRLGNRALGHYFCYKITVTQMGDFCYNGRFIVIQKERCMTTLLRVSALSLALVLAVTGCKKDEPAETPKAETKTEVPAEQASKATDLDSSPTVKMMGDMWKIGTVAILGGMHPNMSETQVSCLMDSPRYNEIGKEEALKLIGEDGIKASDEFYRTEVGQKALKFMEQQQLIIQGKKVEGELVEITQEDQAKMVEFSQTETGKKLEAMSAGADVEEMSKKMVEIANEEKARCNIS